MQSHRLLCLFHEFRTILSQITANLFDSSAGDFLTTRRCEAAPLFGEPCVCPSLCGDFRKSVANEEGRS